MLFILFRDRLITKHRVELDGENSSNDLISQATGAEQTSKNETSEDTKNEQLQTDVDESDLEEANSKVTEILHQHSDCHRSDAARYGC